ncbi:MAG: trypsin-like serine protease, partial [Deltaproteobacteria bacterium]|nr:trypsin-like serine protease [Deltaproteobacteria bacterium]
MTTFDYPAVGGLARVDDFGNPNGDNCSGTLVGCRTFLTAAHCVCPESRDFASCMAEGGPILPSNLVVFFQNAGFFNVSGVAVNPDFIHPTFDPTHTKGDVAIITLAEPVLGIPPAHINARTEPAFGTGGTIVGFGGVGGPLDSLGLSVGVGIKRYGTVATASCFAGPPEPALICWNPGQRSSICHGDSGGPVLIDFGSGPVVAGISSFGSGSCLTPPSGGATDVFNFGSWIQAQAGDDLSNSSCGNVPQVGSAGASVSVASDQVTVSDPSAVFPIQISPGTTLARFALNGELRDPATGAISNNLNLYVKEGSPPTVGDSPCKGRASFGFCEVNDPAPGTWYMGVLLGSGLGGEYQLTATLFGSNPAHTPTATPSPTARATATPSRTPTTHAPATQTPTPPATATHPPTSTPTFTATRTFTRPAATHTFTPSRKPTTAAPTRTATATPSPMRSPTPTRTTTHRATPTLGPCYGDCSGDGQVTINEILTGVNIALGNASVAACIAFDFNADGAVTIDEILSAVNAAL